MSDTTESVKLFQSITVAIIILVVTIPDMDNSYNQNYVLDFCIEGSTESSSNGNAISFERLDFLLVRLVSLMAK